MFLNLILSHYTVYTNFHSIHKYSSNPKSGIQGLPLTSSVITCFKYRYICLPYDVKSIFFSCMLSLYCSRYKRVQCVDLKQKMTFLTVMTVFGFYLLICFFLQTFWTGFPIFVGQYLLIIRHISFTITTQCNALKISTLISSDILVYTDYMTLKFSCGVFDHQWRCRAVEIRGAGV